MSKFLITLSFLALVSFCGGAHAGWEKAIIGEGTHHITATDAGCSNQVIKYTVFWGTMTLLPDLPLLKHDSSWVAHTITENGTSSVGGGSSKFTSSIVSSGAVTTIESNGFYNQGNGVVYSGIESTEVLNLSSGEYHWKRVVDINLPGCSFTETQVRTATLPITLVPTAVVTLRRPDLVTVVAAGTPSDGSFAFRKEIVSGTNIGSINPLRGESATKNPNTAVLTDPPNVSGVAQPGGLAAYVASYKLGGETEIDSFNAATFGMSCYNTTGESDFGIPPNKCETRRYRNQTYDGTETDPNGLKGTYCRSFILMAKINGSAQLINGTKIQYNNFKKIFTVVPHFLGSDGTPVIADHTVARDKGPLPKCTTPPSGFQSIIPDKNVTIDVDGVGQRLLANDRGCNIVGYRLDLYRGAGEAVCKRYKHPIGVAACAPAQSGCPGSTIK